MRFLHHEQLSKRYYRLFKAEDKDYLAEFFNPDNISTNKINKFEKETF